MSKTKRLLLVSALLIAATAASAKPKLTIPFEQYRLPNGLQVILHQDRSVPLVAVSVWYHVGSGDERYGKSGFAHLFEHMMFQGSKNTGEDMHFRILRAIGASKVNGTTNSDRTNYYEVVPSQHLETALWLESDRMGYLLPMVTQKSFKNQTEVVRNERRQSYENRPYGNSRFDLFEMLYPERHPYRYLTIGRHADLAAASLKDVRDFYKTWYVPANATLAISGDFNKKKAKALVKKWFGSFPKSTKPKAPMFGTPKMVAQRKVTTDKLARLTRLHLAWHTPPFLKPGDAEFDLLASVLGREGTGRLYKRLVLSKLSQNVAVYQASAKFSSTFNIMVDLMPSATVAQIEKIVNDELTKIRSQPITAVELKRAITAYVSHFVWQLESLMQRGELLQRYNHYLGDPNKLGYDLKRYRGVTADKILALTKKYLLPSKRATLVVKPGRTR